MGNTDEIVNLIRKQSENFEDFKSRQEARFGEIQKDIREIEKKAGRPRFDGGDSSATATKREGWIDAKSGKPLTVLEHGQSLAALSTKSEATPSVGRLLRGICLGGAAPDADELTEERKSLSIGSDPSGGFTVQGILADQWIDNLRAASVLSRAGALTLPMESGQVSIARVTGDPSCSWHGESVALPESDVTFGRLNLTAKTIVCLVRFSLELAQDSANLETQLQNVITNAMAAAIDSAGLNGVTTNAAGAPGGIMNLTGRNSVTSIGAPTSWDFVTDGMYELMLDNVPMESIGAFIAHPAVYKKMRKLKTGITNDNTPLTMPAEIAALPKLWTTAAPLTGGTTASGIIANWRDLVFGVRQQITVRVLSEAYMGSNLELAVLAYARCDFGAARANSFCSLEGITI